MHLKKNAAMFVCVVLQAAAQNPTASKDRGHPGADRDPTELDIPRSSDPGKQPFLRNFVADEWRMMSSPFRTSSYSSRTVEKYVIPFALISTAFIASDSRTQEILPNTEDQRVWFGRVSQLGAAYTLAGASGALYGLGKMTGNKHLRETGWLGLEAIAHTQLVVFGMKQITNRKRPILEKSGAGFWSGGDSFPSGHAATSFAVATVFAYEYRHHIAVPITAYTVASLVSISRLGARRHWLSDIFVGGSTGFLIGRYIYKRHHDPSLPGSPVNRTTASRLIPDVGFGMRGATLTWAW
jgi:membrane-associated phospholipid phosphatase